MKIAIFIGVVIVCTYVSNYFRWGFDDTDDVRPGQTFGVRSGLTIYTDYKTGVQYVKCGLFGSSTPRLDRNGKPIVTKEVQ